MKRNKNLFKVGQILKMPGTTSDIFYGFPTNVQMLERFDPEKILEFTERWGARSGILKIINNIEEYKSDLIGMIPDYIIKSISKNAIFEISSMGIVYVYPFDEIEITKVVHVSEMQGKNYFEYEFYVAGINVNRIKESYLEMILNKTIYMSN